MDSNPIKEIIVDENKIRIDQYLSKKLIDFSRSKIKGLIQNKMILVDGASVKPSQILRQNQIIKCNRRRTS